MRMKRIKKSLSLIFCMMLIVAMALFTSGCNDKATEMPVVQETETAVTVLGEGETKFLFTVVDKDGVETAFEIYTDKEIVGEALLELGLIEGEEGEFGLFVKVVNGIVADYEVDKTYWAFYVNGEYAMSGVDTTIIEEGTSYMFKVEK